MISGLVFVRTEQFGRAQNQEPTQGITVVQSLADGVMLDETYSVDNVTGQETRGYAGNQTSATLMQSPTQGNVLVAAVGVNTVVSNVQSHYTNVSTITQNGVTWTRQVSNFYLGWMCDVEIWLGIVGPNANSTLTFTIATDPPQPSYSIVAYSIREYSGVATDSPLDQTAINTGFTSASDTGKTAVTTKAKELWIGAILFQSSAPQTWGRNNFTVVGGDPNVTGGRLSTALLEKIVNEKGMANSGTSAVYNGEVITEAWMGCIATFYAQDQTNSPNLLATPSPPPSNQNNSLPTLQFSCQSTTASIIKVNIKGTVTASGAGVADAPVLFSYSVNNGASWNDLTTVNTDNSGSFTVLWTPSVTGNYMVKAVWNGNADYPQTSTTVNLAITPFDSQSFFSINSNSTLSELSFDSANKLLTFTVNGSSGTTGYVEVYIPKTLMNDISGLKVNLDGKTLSYSSKSVGDSWLVSFTYHHSTHQVAMNLNAASSNVLNVNQIVEGVLIGAAIAVVAIALVLVIVKKTKK